MPPLTRSAIVIVGLILCSSCVHYEAKPIDPDAVLARFDAITLDAAATSNDATVPTLSADAAAAFALEHHPRLRARRAAIGVARAQLVEAGLLPDPHVSFDGMDAIAAAGIDGRAETIDFVSGLGLSWPLPRPGEIDANEARAKAEVDVTLAEMRAEEWRLVRDVIEAYLELLTEIERASLHATLRDLARETARQVGEARAAGAATVLEENLAALDASRLERERLTAERGVVAARRRVNALLGLRPDAEWRPSDSVDALAVGFDGGGDVRGALERRPDIAALVARHRIAEAAVRLAVAKQFPSIEIGTGVSIELALGSNFGRHAIATAEAERERVGAELEAAIFDVRAEIAAASAECERFAADVASYESEIRTRLEANVRLLGESLRLRNATLTEVLAAQQQMVEARTHALDARLDLAHARLDLAMASGLLPLTYKSTPASRPTDSATDAREENAR